MRNRFLTLLKSKSYTLLFALWAGGAFWICSPRFVDAEVTPQWLWAVAGGAVWLLLAATGLLRGREGAAPFTPRQAARVVCLMAAALAAYALLQGAGLCPGRNGFAVTGRSDNPAGVASALALSAPFFLGMLRRGKRWEYALWGAGLAAVAAAVAASGSRAGMAALWAEGMLLAALRLRGRRRAAVLALCLAAGAAAGTFLYFHKQGSADGRLLIWRCTAEMAASRPFAGYGPGGFEAHYMDFQADYFARHPDSRFALLADDVKHPFCEYLGVTAEYGLAGLAALAAAAVLLVRLYRRGRGWEADCGLLCAAGWAVFALFSYPGRYAHTWLLAGMAVWMLLRAAGMTGRGTAAGRFLRHGAVRTAGVILSLGLLAGTAVRADAEMRWRRAAHRVVAEGWEAVVGEYEQLMKPLGREPLFLYNYAAELNWAGRYGESLRVGERCLARYADYYTRLLLCDNCMNLRRYGEAAAHARQAARMCPGRLQPRKALAEALMAAGRRDEACRVAREGLRMPVKVESAATELLRADLHRLLQEAGNGRFSTYKDSQRAGW